MEESMTQQKINKQYLKNFILLCFDSFFFSFALGIFSYITVFPYYVSKISKSNLLVSLIPAIMFIGTNGFQIFSCASSINSKNEKKLLLKISLLQRIGFFLIFLSSIILKVLEPFVSLIFFFIAFGIFAATNGYMQPIYTSVVAKLMNKNRGKFYGTSYMVGGFSGIVGAYITKVVLGKYSYPDNFTYLYLIGVVVSLFSMVVYLMLKGDLSSVSDETLTMKEVFTKFKKSAGENRGYKRFLIGRSLIAIGEIATSFYIGRATAALSGKDNLVGSLTMVMLISQSIFSLAWGYIGDKKGYRFTLKVSAFIGIIINIIALTSRASWVFFLLFILVGAIVNGIVISNINLSINYSTKELLPVFVAATNIVIMPFIGIGPIVAGFLADKFSLSVVFAISLIGYLAGFLFFIFDKEEKKI